MIKILLALTLAISLNAAQKRLEECSNMKKKEKALKSVLRDAGIFVARII